MCPVALSGVLCVRAATRHRLQYDAWQRYEPPLITRPEAVALERVHRSRAQPAVLADVVRRKRALPDVAPVLAAGGQAIAPRISLLRQPSACRVPPLRLGRKALARPRREHVRVVPGHVHHGVVGAVIHVRARSLRMLPTHTVDQAPPGRRLRTTRGKGARGQEGVEHERPAESFGLGRVAGGVDEAHKIGVGDSRSDDPRRGPTQRGIASRMGASPNDRPDVGAQHAEGSAAMIVEGAMDGVDHAFRRDPRRSRHER